MSENNNKHVIKLLDVEVSKDGQYNRTMHDLIGAIVEEYKIQMRILTLKMQAAIYTTKPGEKVSMKLEGIELELENKKTPEETVEIEHA
jgi:hypothetical protein